MSDWRNKAIEALEQTPEWDLIVIGGGASGLGAALDSAARGYRTLLLEQDDFAKGTSSRSTKLVHGGVRYLAQGNFSLVREALKERGWLRKNAPHLVYDQPFVIPCYSWWGVPFFTVGLVFYDLLAGRWGIGRTRPLGMKSTLEHLPCIKSQGLRGGVRYFDCQFDDARLAVNLAQTIGEQGGVALNYTRVEKLLKEEGRITGVIARDLEMDRSYTLRSRAVINATGVFVDEVLRMDDPDATEVVRPSQGIHLVLEKRFMDGGAALMIPKTSDGRVLFALPWHQHLVVGTTDVEKEKALLEPEPERKEVEYILETAGRYLDCPPGREDVLSVFTGLRPLAAPRAEGQLTREISRGHRIMVSGSGLVTIIGGKWTTYRKMGEDVVRKALSTLLPYRNKTVTSELALHGSAQIYKRGESHACYGSDREAMLCVVGKKGEEVLSEELGILHSQVIWAVRQEMARTPEDFLCRRSRAMQLDAREALRIAPEVTSVIASELGRSKSWEDEQMQSVRQIALLHQLS